MAIFDPISLKGMSWPEERPREGLEAAASAFRCVYPPNARIAVVFDRPDSAGSQLLDRIKENSTEGIVVLPGVDETVSLSVHVFDGLEQLMCSLLDINAYECPGVYFVPVPRCGEAGSYLSEALPRETSCLDGGLGGFFRKVAGRLFGRPILSEEAVQHLPPFICWFDGTFFLSRKLSQDAREEKGT